MKWLLLTASLGMLAGCNTMGGLGEDMQNAGHGLTNKATEQQHQDNTPPPYQERLAYPENRPTEILRY